MPPRLTPPTPRLRSTVAAFTALTLGAAGLARAGSFQINEQSVSGLGTAFAGAGIAAEDPSVLFFNPAGATFLPQVSSQTAINYIHPRAEFDNQGSSYGGAFPIRGSDGGGGGRGGLVPNGYYHFPMAAVLPNARIFQKNPYLSDISFDLALTAPFGLVTSYDPNFVGRYFALRSKLATFDIAPSVSFKVLDRISFGIGLDVQYIAARLTQAVDFGLIGFATPGLGPQRGFLPGNQDGTLELYGNDWSVGFNAGVIFEFIKKGQHLGILDDARLGVSFRSGITHELNGDAEFRRVPAPLQGTFRSNGVTATAKLPETYRFSAYQGFARHFALVGDLTWTRWSRLQGLPIAFDNTPGLNNTLVLNYDDAFRFAGGLLWFPNEKLTLRVGAAYDETPIQSKTTRTPRIPDADRIFVGTGFKYQVASLNLPVLKHVDVDLDFGYAHLFVNDPQVNVTDNQLHNLVGKYNAHVDILSSSLTFRYGPRPQSAAPAPKDGKDSKGTAK